MQIEGGIHLKDAHVGILINQKLAEIVKASTIYLVSQT